MKILVLITAMTLYGMLGLAQNRQVAKGTINDATTERAIQGATIRNTGTNILVVSDIGGNFIIDILSPDDSLVVTAVGYERKAVHGQTILREERVILSRSDQFIETVDISTGYYSIPKERATGTFVHIDNKSINQSSGPNILQRLNGLAPGVQFVAPNGSTASDIRVRGLSTIESDEKPLIVLDNFPYDGDINNIDPNDIESITILQDAAASSIWGAKAGNGVIVITTKSPSKDGSIRSSVHSDIRLSDNSDLFYDRTWLDARTMMAIEKEKYDLGLYGFADNTAIPYYVHLLRAQGQGTISPEDFERMSAVLAHTDVRMEAMDYLYRRPLLKQLGFNLSGGMPKYNFAVTANLSDQQAEIRDNSSKRYTLGFRNRFEPFKWLNVDLGLNYVGHSAVRNGTSYSDLTVTGLGISPYQGLRDASGASLPVTRGGLSWDYLSRSEDNNLLDWYYRPLDESGLQDRRDRSYELRNNLSIQAKLFKDLTAGITYQYTLGESSGYALYSKDSYYVRDMVNRFTQQDGTKVIPHNAIYRTNNPARRSVHNGRFMLRYQGMISQDHELSALAGADLTSAASEIFPGSVLYNYSEEYLTGSTLFDFTKLYPVRPVSVSNIPGPPQSRQLLRNRELSYFSNASYTYLGRYILSGSLRYDASNLFGVKTNDKGVPLWSLGGSWNIAKEEFYPFKETIEHLRFKYTYGIAGNINKAVSHFPVVSYGNSPIGLSYGSYRTFGNPSLRWEQVSTSNIGLEWRMLGGRIGGNFDGYVKHGRDLIGDDFMDPTTGIVGEYKVNYANIKTRGWDLSVTTKNLTGPLEWRSTLIWSRVSNKVTHFTARDVTPISDYLGARSIPIEGKSRDILFAIPYDGLSADGLPLVYMDGEPTTDYINYHNRYLKLEMLQDMGVRIPKNYGSVRNVIVYRSVEFTALLTWKGRYMYQRVSMEPDGEFSNKYHEDYHRRWQSTGDEALTEVPRKILPSETDVRGASLIYRNGTPLVENGSHIRLQNVGLAYQIPSTLIGKHLEGMRVYANASNLGLLWKATSDVGDPDYRNGGIPEPFNITFGLNINF